MQARKNINLRRQALWLVPGVLVSVLVVILTCYTVSLSPPSIERNSAEYAAATTEVMVDFPGESALLSTQYPVESLAERANIYARLATSPAIRQLIGDEAGIEPELIDIAGPYNPDVELSKREPTAERRALQLQAERLDYRIRFDTEPDQAVPIVLVYAQAPTVPAAERLADAAVSGLVRYVESIQDADGLEQSKRLQLNPLGAAVGGVVNPGVDGQIAILVFVAAMLAWTVATALSVHLFRLIRARRTRSDAAALTDERHHGDGVAESERDLEGLLVESGR